MADGLSQKGIDHGMVFRHDGQMQRRETFFVCPVQVYAFAMFQYSAYRCRAIPTSFACPVQHAPAGLVALVDIRTT